VARADVSAVNYLIEAGAWAADQTGGNLGVDLGFVNVGFYNHDGHKGMQFGAFGGEVRDDLYHGNIDTTFGEHFGVGINGYASVGETYMDDTFSASGSIGPLNGSIGYNTAGHYWTGSAGLSVIPFQGAVNYSAGYGWNFGPGGTHSGINQGVTISAPGTASALGYDGYANAAIAARSSDFGRFALDSTYLVGSWGGRPTSFTDTLLMGQPLYDLNPAGALGLNGNPAFIPTWSEALQQRINYNNSLWTIADSPSVSTLPVPQAQAYATSLPGIPADAYTNSSTYDWDPELLEDMRQQSAQLTGGISSLFDGISQGAAWANGMINQAGEQLVSGDNIQNYGGPDGEIHYSNDWSDTYGSSSSYDNSSASDGLYLGYRSPADIPSLGDFGGFHLTPTSSDIQQSINTDIKLYSGWQDRSWSDDMRTAAANRISDDSWGTISLADARKIIKEISSHPAPQAAGSEQPNPLMGAGPFSYDPMNMNPSWNQGAFLATALKYGPATAQRMQNEADMASVAPMMNDMAAMHEAGLGPWDTLTLSLARQTPILQSVIAGTELYTGLSLYGANIGQDLSLGGKAGRWFTIGVDSVTAGLSLTGLRLGGAAAENGMSLAARQEMVAARTAEHVALRGEAADLLYQARASGMTPTLRNDLRMVGANLGWAEESQMVRLTGQGTRAWSPAEISELMQNGGVDGYTPHHINSVAQNPWLAGNANNIQIVERWTEHGLIHGGNTQIPTQGPFINRSQMMVDWLTGR